MGKSKRQGKTGSGRIAGPAPLPGRNALFCCCFAVQLTHPETSYREREDIERHLGFNFHPVGGLRATPDKTESP